MYFAKVCRYKFKNKTTQNGDINFLFCERIKTDNHLIKENMIARVGIKGNYIETIDEKGKRIKRAVFQGDFLGNSSDIVILQKGNYTEVLDENLKRLSRFVNDFDRFLGASGETFSVQDGNYAETYDKKGKRISRKVA